MFVVIEGIDGAGKGTVTAAVADRLKAEYQKTVSTVSFPRYEQTVYGRLIGRYLNGEFGESTHRYLPGTLYSLDRFEARDWLKEQIRLHDVVLSDRYVSSNLCYSAMKAPPELRHEIAKHFTDFEFGELGASKPDVHVFLDMPVDFAVQNIAKKAKRVYTDRPADIIEADHAFLAEVRKFYVEDLCRYLPGKTTAAVIECVKDGELRSIESITQSVCSLIVDANGKLLF